MRASVGFETTGVEARQAQQQRITARDAEVAAVREECRSARVRGDLKTYVAEVQCGSSRIRDAQKRAGNPNMDLVDLAQAVRLSDAEKIDKHQLSEAEATLQTAQAISQITDQARRRGLETRTVENQEKSAQAQAAQADAAQIQNILLMQPRQVQLQVQPTLGPTPRQPVTCNTSGSTTTCVLVRVL